MSDNKLNEIAQVLFPRGISRSGLLRLGACDRVDVDRGRVIAEAGGRVDCVFVVLRGYVDVGRRRCGPGDVLGDAAALVHAPWEQSAVVAREARLLVIPAQRFASLLEDVPEFNAVVMRALSARLLTAERQVSAPRVALVN